MISNGTDEAIRFHLSSDFVVNADEDGEVIDYDQKTGVLMLKYKSGKTRAIDLSPHIVKNGGGGFFLNNTLITNLQVGDKFKKDEALAWHKDFFKNELNKRIDVISQKFTREEIQNNNELFNE